MDDIRQTAVDPITGRRYDDLPQMTETPRSPRMGMLADALMAVRDFANRMQIPQGVPLLGGEGVGSLLLGKAPEELVEMSYGNMPLRINPYAGQTASFVPEMKPGRGAQVADLLSLVGVPGGGRTAAAAIGGAAADLGGVERAMLAYHGTPHRFERFDASKIGTGEGAQAYGHGLYFAESPDVAKGYQSALSADRGFSFAGKTDLTRAEVQDMVNQKYGSGYLDGVIRPSGVADSFIDDMITGVQRKEGAYPRNYKPDSERAKLYDELRGQISHANPGSLYTVDIPDEMVGKMLDWDKPLSEQSDFVKRAIGLDKNPNASIKDWTGMEFYVRTGEKLGEPSSSSKAAAEHLRKKGIAGVRYLDAGSRGSFKVQNTYKGQPYGDPVSFKTEAQAKEYAAEQIEKGFGADIQQGTSNFVVFPGEEQNLKIMERE